MYGIDSWIKNNEFGMEYGWGLIIKFGMRLVYMISTYLVG